MSGVPYLSYMLQFVSAKIQIRVQILRAQEEISGREAGSRHLVTSLFNSRASVETKGSEDHKLFQWYCPASFLFCSQGNCQVVRLL